MLVQLTPREDVREGERLGPRFAELAPQVQLAEDAPEVGSRLGKGGSFHERSKECGCFLPLRLQVLPKVRSEVTASDLIPQPKRAFGCEDQIVYKFPRRFARLPMNAST